MIRLIPSIKSKPPDEAHVEVSSPSGKASFGSIKGAINEQSYCRNAFKIEQKVKYNLYFSFIF